MNTKEEIKDWMWDNFEHLIDPITLEINTTRLAEEAADYFGAYINDDYEIPEELYDWAVEIEARYAQENGYDGLDTYSFPLVED